MSKLKEKLWEEKLLKFQIETTPIWWDNKSLYLDQRIVTLKDGVARSVGYTKIGLVKFDLDALLKKHHPSVQKPECPEDLKKWIDHNEISSEKMKRK